ncbi:DUF3732 domain-containing protein [Undibacterium sp. Tian12W]|uniref:DUF3732 domain-containing protein n=1 Tax=Undibacterium sp. Tian12W TaxID=3413054 RepID=UPI003BF025A4
MRFTIEQLVLWPQDEKNEMFVLDFVPGKINIIHGRSGTGKSSILAIIDYCLGATRCAIPVGVIRDNVEWFGLVLLVQGQRVVIARHTPGERQASKEFFIDTINDDVPRSIVSTHTDAQFKQAFNNLVRLTNLPLTTETEIGQYDGRPSYRDLAAFNFLPQHIVANPNTLFYKADSYDHKEKLKKVMPFALGIIDNEYAAKERERVQLQRTLDELVKQRDTLRRSMKTWDSDVNRLWDEAVELGLAQVDEVLSTGKKVEKFVQINSLFLKKGLEDVLTKPNFSYTNQKYKETLAQEEQLQKQVDISRRQVRGLEQLAARATDFRGAVNRERDRVINLDWLKSHIGNENECIACGSSTNQLSSVISRLDSEVNRVGNLSRALFENPIVEKEIEAAKKLLRDLTDGLQEKRAARIELAKIETATKDSLSRVYILLGKIQSLISAFATLKNEDETSQKISHLTKQIRELDSYFAQSGKGVREAKVDAQISNLIEVYAEGFGLERRGSINLDKSELTLSFLQHPKAKKEYLWEVGSGANWMGYHIAAFMALHEFFSQEEQINSPVFSFLVIDQPSQVYFPSAASGANELDSDPLALAQLRIDRNFDINATKRIFEMLELGLQRASYNYQIIVLEHADESIWGECLSAIEVANWKAEDQGLIPKNWIRALKH